MASENTDGPVGVESDSATSVSAEIEQIKGTLQRAALSRRVARATSVGGFAVMTVLFVVSFTHIFNTTAVLFAMVVVLLLTVLIPMAVPTPAPPDLSSLDQMLVRDCDPYRFARAYSDLLGLLQGDQERIVCTVNVALGLFLQGNYQQMNEYLASVNLGRIPMAAVSSYYDLQAHYYIVTGNMQGLYEVEARLSAFIKAYPQTPAALACDQTMMLVQAFRALNAGSYDSAYEVLDRRNQAIIAASGGTSPFQQVEYHYLCARVGYRARRDERMVEDCRYVIDNGNLLVYVQLAGDMLART